MNEQELRDHLRTTLEPVEAPRPSARALRATATRRTRRNRLAAGGVAVVALAAAGTGVGLAAGGSSTARVQPVASPTGLRTLVGSPSVIEAPCSPQTITVQVGQTLLVMCRSPKYSTTTSTELETHLSAPSGPTSYVARAAGDATISLFQQDACPTGQACAQPTPFQIGTITVHVVDAPGASASPSLAQQALVPCSGGTRTLPVGDELVLSDCPSGSISVDDSDTSVLRANAVPETYPTPPPTFTALKAGTATLTITARPVCEPGAVCSNLVQQVGTVHVSVTDGTVGPTSSATAVPSSTTSSTSGGDDASGSQGPPYYDPSDPSTWKISITGIGPIEVGMTPAQIAAVAPGSKAEYGGTDPSQCEYVSVPQLPQVQLLSTSDGFLVAEVDQGSTLQSVSGIHVGMTEAALKAALGPNATIEPGGDANDKTYELKTSQGVATADVYKGVVQLFTEGKIAMPYDGCV